MEGGHKGANILQALHPDSLHQNALLGRRDRIHNILRNGMVLIDWKYDCLVGTASMLVAMSIWDVLVLAC